jgi:hypothetical protein
MPKVLTEGQEAVAQDTTPQLVLAYPVKVMEVVEVMGLATMAEAVEVEQAL